MLERMELGFPETNPARPVSLKEQIARTTLNNLRSQGHTYVELREDGKRFVFFCTLCLAPCYSDSILLDHLKGNLHTERLSAAKVTLFGPNPWPFNDGILFFDNANENENQLGVVKGNQSKLSQNNDHNLAIVPYNGTSQSSSELSKQKKKKNGKGGNSELVIPYVLTKDEVSDLKVSLIGFGQIAARFFEKDGVTNELGRIWCEWLGKNDPRNEEKVKTPKHDFAIVTFSYNVDLGRRGLLDDIKLLMASGSPAQSENHEGLNRKRKKSSSDPEETSASKSTYDSSEEDSISSNDTSSRLVLARYDDQPLHLGHRSSKALRRELRRQQRIAAERMCDICQQKMLPQKDVATLVNLKTGKLACSSRNVNGAFHVYHISCLIHWILLCEQEIIGNHPVGQKGRRRSRSKAGPKNNEGKIDGETKAVEIQISSALCPECQGTGIDIEGDKLERPLIPLSQMFKYKIKVSDGRRAWVKSPEILKNCSTGLHFPSQSKDIVEGKVSPLKVLRFYKAEQ